ncbi:endo-alpha-N-acetylgalactosaminidase family protein [Microbacterium sp.]|uniref:endo-alpha-N-acetylgalactosaminidase family protein n=1 Tax=Microbacterium sp. TaxID=51671 RepID=UPI0028128492|nr:endo-alpha-N-acetylgalactosaminidase family protein [Microbacterium sp.]
MKTPRRWAGAGLGCALVITGLSPLAAAPAWGADAAAEHVLRSGTLEVRASQAFPQVVSYTDRDSGAVLHGKDTLLTSLEINGTAQPVTVTSTKIDKTTVEYTITPTELADVRFTARLSVEKNVVTLAFTEIHDPDARVVTLRIPGHDLVTVSSREPGSAIAAANLSVDRAVSGDTFLSVTRETPVDAKPVSSNTILAHTGELAAAFTTNALYDSSPGPANKDSGNFWRQAVKDGDEVEVGVSSGQWLYRAKDAEEPEELPWVKVAITPDANADGTVDWQDGAIALRDLRVGPFKGDQTPNNVITHIPFNFASQATHPFLRTLDDVKRIALNTDGLGQVAMLKGYTSEGHDSANTDYGDNFNERAGGLDELNTALEAAEKWNASFGVHINATEIYPEANSFSDEIAEEDKPGWNWLDQSYYIDQRYDRVSGELDERIGELADATHDNLDFVYVDVYYEHGWLAKTIQDSLVEHGFRVGSEWADKLAANNTWSHWANDENYGGSTNKGVNSKILRFVNNTEADVWNPDPRLGTSHIVEFEGWTGQNDFNGFLENVWKANVPAKFLQHHEITRWTDEAVDFEGGVRATGTTAADRSITVDGTEVLRGGTYLLPWASKPGGDVDKLYHYNPAGGSTTWTLTEAFAGNATLQLFALGDGGREKVADLPVSDGAVTIEAAPGQPYVLVAGTKADAGNALPSKVRFGEGTPVTDPGFNRTGLDAWNPTGAVSIERDGLGRRSALFGVGASAISQRLGELAAGEYTASAWVGIDATKTRETTLSVVVPGGKDAAITIDSSNARNYMASDEWNGTTLQRLKVHFTVPADGTRPKLTIAAADGDAPVRVDDVRIIAAKAPKLDDGVIAREDFEDVDAGWGPFIKGRAGGTTDPRTHIAKRHEPYTQAGWNGRDIDNILNGDWSLMAHEENSGLVYRTSEYTVPFEQGRRYRVSFDYQSTLDGEYAWVSGYDSAAGPVVTGSVEFGAVHGTTRFEQIVDGSPCGDAFVGLQRIGGGAADLILDDFLVEDLGPADSVPACAQLRGELGPDVVQQGVAQEFTTTFTSDESAPIADLAVSLELPEGWTAEATTPATAADLPAKGRLDTTWSITAPASADGSYPITATATYTTTVDPIGPRTISSTTTVRTLPKPPQADVYASDHDWVSATNGWGPVERDQSNGEQGQGDGAPITLNGVVYEKGLGAHAPSKIRYYLGGYCTVFTADVGVDDKQPTRGSVTFAVVADGRTVATSPLMKATTATHALSADITGAQFVDLVVGDGGDGIGNDHADWADAKFSCSDTPSQGGGGEEPTAPAGTAYLSDLPFVSEANGWGPVERDMSNGEDAAGDGTPLTIGGVTFAKGLGTHADSSVKVYLGGQCTTFTATVGLDDSKDEKGEGDVIFRVRDGATVLHDTGSITWDDPGTPIIVDVTGVEVLELVVDKNGVDFRDHADWADAKVVCAE